MKTKWGYFLFCLCLGMLIAFRPIVGGIKIGPGLLVAAICFAFIWITEHTIVITGRQQKFAKLKELAHSGDSEAMFRLAVSYESGEGTATDLKSAAFCYRKAAESGHTEAKYEYAICLRDGIGVPQDLNQAKIIFESLAEEGDEAAMHRLNEMKSK